MISIFSTTVIAGGVIVIVNLLRPFSYYQQEGITTVFAFIAFILAMTLILGRQHLKSWNYIAGVFMLMLGVVFLASWVVIVDNFNLEKYILPMIAALLPVSLIVSLIVAWAVAKRNDMPVLR